MPLMHWSTLEGQLFITQPGLRELQNTHLMVFFFFPSLLKKYLGTFSLSCGTHVGFWPIAAFSCGWRDDINQIKSLALTVCPWVFLSLRRATSGFKVQLILHLITILLLASSVMEKSTILSWRWPVDICAAWRLVYMLKWVKNPSVLFWAAQQGSAVLRHTIILNNKNNNFQLGMGRARVGNRENFFT